jgi:large subunit ribosomal protein L28
MASKSTLLPSPTPFLGCCNAARADEFVRFSASLCYLPAAVVFTKTPQGRHEFQTRPRTPQLASPRQNCYNSCLPSQFGNLLELVMAQVCEICGKRPMSGNNISHAHNVTRRRWNLNLRPVHAQVKGGSKRMRVCTSCLRSGKVTKA